jgi:hypothetical protein
MKQCLFASAWAGFGLDWYRFDQAGQYMEVDPGETRAMNVPPGSAGAAHLQSHQPYTSQEGADDESSDGPSAAMFMATEQRVRSEFVDPRHFRRDPDGRAWDFSDHKWIARRYSRSLQDVWEDETIPMENRQMVVAWYSDRTPHGSGTKGEMDPAFLPVYIWEIYSKVTKEIIHLPESAAGKYANFDLGVYPWPRALAESDLYPGVMIAFNRSADNDEGIGGWAPIPELRLIRSQLENLNRLEGLFLESATKALNVYFTWKGIIKPAEFNTVMASDNNRQIVELDPETALQIQPGTELPNLRDIIQLLPNGDDHDRAVGFAQMIDHELTIIYQVTGQGPGDRGGVAEADSATEAANIRAQLDKRTNDRVEEVEAAFLRGTNIIWQLIRKCQTLPIPYRSSTATDPSIWTEMSAEGIEDLELFFKVAAGSSRPRNRAQVKIDRSELFQNIAPLLMQPLTEEAVAVLIYAITPYEESDDLVTLLYSRLQAQELAAQGAQLDMQISQGQVDPADPKVAIQKQELASKLQSAVLGPGGVAKVAMANKPQPPPHAPPTPGEPRNTGRSAGQIAAAEAAAGRSSVAGPN